MPAPIIAAGAMAALRVAGPAIGRALVSRGVKGFAARQVASKGVKGLTGGGGGGGGGGGPLEAVSEVANRGGSFRPEATSPSVGTPPVWRGKTSSSPPDMAASGGWERVVTGTNAPAEGRQLHFHQGSDATGKGIAKDRFGSEIGTQWSPQTAEGAGGFHLPQVHRKETASSPYWTFPSGDTGQPPAQ